MSPYCRLGNTPALLSPAVYGMSKYIWLSRLGTSRSTVTQAAVFARRDLEFCVWHWKINGLIHKQTHRCMHELLLKAAQRQAASTGLNSPLQRFTGATRGKEWEVLISASLSLSRSYLSPLIFSVLCLSQVAVDHGGGLWLNTRN